MWRLEAAHLDVVDVGLRRPSLDDVFLALTNDSAKPAAHDQSTTDVMT
jgi:hypothetical protein